MSYGLQWNLPTSTLICPIDGPTFLFFSPITSPELPEKADFIKNEWLKVIPYFLKRFPCTKSTYSCLHSFNLTTLVELFLFKMNLIE